MKNSIMQNKAIIIFLIAVIIFSLTGCSATKQVDKKTNVEVSMEAQAVSKNSDSNITSKSTTASVDQTTKKGKEGTNASIEEVRTENGPKPLDLRPHDPIDEGTATKTWITLPTLMPYYGKDWRMQVIEFKGNTAVIDFGNTGSKPLVISNDNVYYLLLSANGGNNIADSNIVGGPVTIAPNEIKRVTIKAGTPDARVIHITINGSDRDLIYLPKGETISDAKTYTARVDDDLRMSLGDKIPQVMAPEIVSGNGKFKYVIEEVQMTSNDHIGTLRVPSQLKTSNSSIVLVKVKIANTSKEVMTINEFRENCRNYAGYKGIPIPNDALEALDGSALPMTIQPGSIVEGYVPMVLLDSDTVHYLIFETNLGPFMASSVEKYPIN